MCTVLVGCSSPKTEIKGALSTQNSNSTTTVIPTSQVTDLTNNAERKATATSIPKVTRTTSDDKTKNLVNEFASRECKFYLGMTMEDVKSTLKGMKIDITNETEITDDDKAWDFGNRVLDAGDFRFLFDEDYILYEIDVYRPTTLGLKLGDSLNTMEKLYGGKYKEYRPPIGVVYEYIIEDHYFIVLFEDNKVSEWRISKYKFDR
jgi:hypothetical protein